jgi:hypothetical protein
MVKFRDVFETRNNESDRELEEIFNNINFMKKRRNEMNNAGEYLERI